MKRRNRKAASRRYYLKHKTDILARLRDYYVKNTDKINDRTRKYHARNKDKASQKYQERRNDILKHARDRSISNIEKYLLRGAKLRAKKYGKPCQITLDDIHVPENCPYLDIPLFKGSGSVCDNSPTLDCIVPEIGYIPGNVIVGSFRANTIKNKGTAEEHFKIAAKIMELRLDSK